ncbi:MAG: GtrA family protein [Coriobacteriales bacterium]
MNTYLRELTVQFAKFGVVGVIAFFIDYGLFLLMDYVFGVNYLVASAVSFTIATIFNFVASMRYVFAGKEGQTRTQQFVIFFVLSLVGLGLNQLILWACVDLLALLAWVGKLVATVLVMLFNFVTRKVFLEDRSPHRG